MSIVPVTDITTDLRTLNIEEQQLYPTHFVNPESNSQNQCKWPLSKLIIFVYKGLNCSRGNVYAMCVYIMHMDVCDLWALKHKRFPHKIK